MRWRRQAVRICQSELDRKPHIRQTDLCHDGTIDILDHRVDQALRLDNDFNILIVYAEEPVRLYDLKPFVKHGRRIERHFRPHVPCRVLHGICDRHLCELFSCPAAERTARSCEKDFMNAFLILPDHTLEDGRMLTVHRTDQRMILFRFLKNKRTACDQRLFVCKSQLLPRANRFKRRKKSCNADDCYKDKVDIVSLHDLRKSCLADQHIRIAIIGFQKFFPRILISDDDGIRMKERSLLL